MPFTKITELAGEPNAAEQHLHAALTCSTVKSSLLAALLPEDISPELNAFPFWGIWRGIRIMEAGMGNKGGLDWPRVVSSPDIHLIWLHVAGIVPPARQMVANLSPSSSSTVNLSILPKITVAVKRLPQSQTNSQHLPGET